jgi:2-oxoglutarate dehydrogenase E1 component
MLERLTAAETLERYLHTRYVGQKRFSLEGAASRTIVSHRRIDSCGRYRRG